MAKNSPIATSPGAEPITHPQRKRRHLSAVVQAANRGDITVPVVIGGLAVLFGLAGWTATLFDGSFSSICEIIVRVVGSFIPKAETVTEGNWASRLGAALAALTTVIGAVMVGLATLGEHVTQAKARHLWTHHTVLIGDTPLARRLAAGFQADGQRVLQVTALDAARTGGSYRVRLGFDIGAIRDATALRRAGLVVVDLGSDAATLSLGRSILNIYQTGPSPRSVVGWPLRRPIRGPAALALRVADAVLADQFSEVIFSERRHQRPPAELTTLRPVMFDENRVIARYTLAHHPLFVIANDKKQRRVHAVVIGFGDLGEKLHDQILLTSAAGSLDVPRVTVLDRHATRREREFRARRPAVLDSLDTGFVDIDIGLDGLEAPEAPVDVGKLLAPESAAGITAIYLALPTDAENLRAALLLRRYSERNGSLDAPIFYRSRLSPEEGDILGASGDLGSSGRFVPMRLSFDALRREIADADRRDALARALHDNYLRGAQTSLQAATAWPALSEPLRRANIRAADHLPAKLWSLGFGIDGLLPGRIPAFDPAAKHWLFGKPGASSPPDALAAIAALAKLEHERWMIERKLDGWRFGPVRDDKRQIHPSLVPWETLLNNAPAEIAKDTEQVWAVLRLVSERGKAPVLTRDAAKGVRV